MEKRKRSPILEELLNDSPKDIEERVKKLSEMILGEDDENNLIKIHNKMNWTEPKPPTKGSSYYDHITTETPLGKAIIEWKSWKERPSYSITIGEDYIDTEYDLEEAKRLVINHLIEKHKELSGFLLLDKS